jgi:hypothetical protein
LLINFECFLLLLDADMVQPMEIEGSSNAAECKGCGFNLNELPPPEEEGDEWVQLLIIYICVCDLFFFYGFWIWLLELKLNE